MASQNLLKVSPASYESFMASIDTEVTEGKENKILKVLEAEVEKWRKKVQFDRVEMPSRSDKDKAPEKSKASADESGSQKPKKSIMKKSEMKSKTSAKKSEVLPVTSPSTPSSTTPQYRYQSPIKDSTILKKIIDCSLDTQFLISQKELLPIFPKLQKQYKELTTTKQVPAKQNIVESVEEVESVETVESTNVELFRGPIPMKECQECHEEILTSVACDMLPLRSVYPMIEGKLTCESVLDTGFQIVAM
jgi:hypothetical protein